MQRHDRYAAGQGRRADGFTAEAFGCAPNVAGAGQETQQARRVDRGSIRANRLLHGQARLVADVEGMQPAGHIDDRTVVEIGRHGAGIDASRT